jgi:hypothetical protein
MKNKNLFKALLIVQTICLLCYTILAFQKEGTDLLGVFLTNILTISWNGQFNLDFSCYLILSGLWIMWRNEFTLASILFGVFATVAGFIVFAPYILFLLVKENGDFRKLLIGSR